MNGPFDRAREQVDRDHEDGNLSDEEYWKQQRDINEEEREYARERAEETYRDIVGDY